MAKALIFTIKEELSSSFCLRVDELGGKEYDEFRYVQ